MEQLGNFPLCFGERAHAEAGGAGLRLRGRLGMSNVSHQVVAELFEAP